MFGRPVRQQNICDEDGYELEPSQSVWKYAKDCNISLMFQYDREKDAESIRATWLMNEHSSCARGFRGSGVNTSRGPPAAVSRLLAASQEREEEEVHGSYRKKI
jgi:hypothetical protein